MDIQKEREAFEEKFPIPAHWIEFDKKRNKYFCPYCADAAASAYQSQWETWQAAKAQAVLEGFVLVPKEPTYEMLEAGSEARSRTEGHIASIWEAMIEAQEQKG